MGMSDLNYMAPEAGCSASSKGIREYVMEELIWIKLAEIGNQTTEGTLTIRD